MLITPGNLDAAFIGFDTMFSKFFKEATSNWDKIATLKQSTNETERYPWLDLIAEMREFGSERVINNLSTRVQSLTNKLYEDTFGIPRTKFEDDTYGIYSEDSIKQLAMAAKMWPDKQVVAALVAGTTTKVFDGQNFFDTSHPVDMDAVGSPTQSNNFSALPLTDANIASVRASMMKYKAANGVPLEVVPKLCVVPPELEFAAKKVFQGETYAAPVGTFGTSPGGAATQSNTMKGVCEVLVLPRLTDANVYYLMDTSRAVKPLIWQLRDAPEFTYMNQPNSPEAFNRDRFLYGVRGRGIAGYGPWYSCARVSQI